MRKPPRVKGAEKRDHVRCSSDLVMVRVLAGAPRQPTDAPCAVAMSCTPRWAIVRAALASSAVPEQAEQAVILAAWLLQTDKQTEVLQGTQKYPACAPISSITRTSGM